MRFTAIVITKKKIAAVSACVLAAALLCTGAAVIKSRESVPTLNYSDIVSEELPGEDGTLNIKKLINRLIGFNADEPEEIAKEGLPYEEPSPEPMSTETPDIEVTPEPTKQPSEFPSKEQINNSVGITANNATDYTVDVNELCGAEMPFAINKEEPSVLVIHTHTTECYNGDAMSGETERTTDDARNMTAVGNVICGILEENGIKTVHDTTVHDYPSYKSAYTRALTTINSNLKKYPSIKVTLDVHRDAFVYEDGSKLRVASDQNGTETAKVMLVVGTDSMGLEHPNWRGNLAFAAKIQNTAQIMYPGLMRPIDIRRERFNMHAAPGSILLEVGSNGNSLQEALEGGADIARAISAVLLND